MFSFPYGRDVILSGSSTIFATLLSCLEVVTKRRYICGVPKKMKKKKAFFYKFLTPVFLLYLTSAFVYCQWLAMRAFSMNLQIFECDLWLPLFPDLLTMTSLLSTRCIVEGAWELVELFIQLLISGTSSLLGWWNKEFECGHTKKIVLIIFYELVTKTRQSRK